MSCDCSIVQQLQKEDDKTLSSTFYLRPRYVGKCILLFGQLNSRFPFQMLVGGDWPCMALTYALIVVATTFFMIFIAYPIGWIAMIIGFVSFFGLLCCYSATACSDPGIIFKTIETELEDEEKLTQPPAYDNNDSKSTELVSVTSETSLTSPKPMARKTSKIECSRCEIMRPQSASHCYTCGTCVNKLDHHCPWTGKCIAEKNLTYFYCFITFLCIHLWYMIILVAVTVVSNVLRNAANDSEER